MYLWISQRRFVNDRLPLSIAKAYIYFLLVGLDYLHSECKVVHTGKYLSPSFVPIHEWRDLTYVSDLKLGNAAMSFENDNIFTESIKQQQPMHYKVDGKIGRAIYRCHNDFGTPDGREIKNMSPMIVDFGLGTRLDKPCTGTATVGEQLGVYHIQPDHYRAQK
jgi:hypothetical protein